MGIERSWFRLRDGTTVFLYGWVPDGEIRGIVQIIHGMAEHALRYEKFAWELVEQGYAVYAHDQRGHGQTALGLENLGMTNGERFDDWVDDVNDITRSLRMKHGWGVSFYLFGHSMGSYIAIRYSQKYGDLINGLILSGSNGKLCRLTLVLGSLLASMQINYYGNKSKSQLLNKLIFGRFNQSFKPSRTAFDWLSRDEMQVDAYVKDPYCGFVCSAAFYKTLFDGLKIIYKNRNMKTIRDELAIYIIAGKSDPVGLFGKGFQRLIDQLFSLGKTNLTAHLYTNARHELLNEINSDQVIENINKWFENINHN